MIAIDTNILVRYFAQDHKEQSQAADILLERTLSADKPGFISLAVLLELNWVMLSAYGAKPEKIAHIINELLQTSVIRVERPSAVRAALGHARVQFSDALIHEVGVAFGCTKTVTFDRRLGQLNGVDVLETRSAP
jgi:predicted nucleic-acid-binding protein